MSESLYNKILGDLSARTQWEQRQRVWYEMRHQGLRRRNKPFPGASDLHFPLVDQIIDRLKPFYVQQIFATELLASFVSLKPQRADLGANLARWFDYKLRVKSQFVMELMHGVDHMLQSAKGIVKPYWDHDRKRLGFDAIDPMFLIVPPYTKALNEADRVCHVQHWSVDQFKRSAHFRSVPDSLIKQISGNGVSQGNPSQDSSYEQEKERREGITCSNKPDQIIVWEVYERDAEGRWVIRWFSPLHPSQELRPTLILPYRHGRLPFVELHMEVKDKGYYSPRSVSELVAAFEASMCKLWNEKLDYMTFVNRPMFTATQPVPGVHNILAKPGQILPFGIEAVPLPQPPMSFDQELMITRQIAEGRIGVPDLAMRQPQTGDTRTATEVDLIANLSMQSNDMRAIIFRLALTEIYQQSYALLLQYDTDFSFLADGTMAEVDPEVLHEAYEITPSGNNDSWNRQAQMQKAMARMKLLQGNPFINQAELVRSVLILDDPQLVKHLFVDPQQQQGEEYENEAHEILLLREGLPVTLSPGENHELRAIALAQYLQATLLKNQPLTPEAVQNIEAHMMQHIQALAQQNPKAARQVQREVQEIAKQTPQMLAQLTQGEAQMAMQQMQMAGQSPEPMQGGEQQ